MREINGFLLFTEIYRSVGVAGDSSPAEYRFDDPSGDGERLLRNLAHRDFRAGIDVADFLPLRHLDAGTDLATENAVDSAQERDVRDSSQFVTFANRIT